MHIEFIGSLDGGNHFSTEVVADLLSGHEIHMVHGAEYTGKPGTLLHVTDSHVLKLKTDKTLNPAFCRKWVQKLLEKERDYAVSIPQKTWLLVEQDGRAIPGNITPRMTPVHLLMQDASLAADAKIDLLGRVLDCCLQFCSRHEQRLDEGLSNFGLDAAGHLWYLDDDFYSRDDYTGLSQMLGVCIRSYDWLDEAGATRLVQSLKGSIQQGRSEDRHPLYVFSEQLGSVFQPPERKPVFDALRHGLTCREAPVPARQRAVDSRVIAFIGDVHANLPALEAVIAALEQQAVSRVIVLGDLVGYGPHPNECIEKIRAHGYEALMGNHDHAIAHQRIDERFTKTARWSAEWTIARMTEANRRWLSLLPPIIRETDFMAVHGAPIDPTFFNAYVYPRTFLKNLDYLVRNGIPRCFHGHTHIPVIYALHKEGAMEIEGSGTVSLARAQAALVCPGAVGHPRSGIGDAMYVTYDRDAAVVTYHRVPYRLDLLIADMQARQFPDFVMDPYVKAA